MRLAWITVFCSAFFVQGFSEARAKAKKPKTIHFGGACVKGEELTIAAAGDLLFHRSLQRQSYGRKSGSRAFFTPLAEVIGKVDVAYANFEGPAADGVAGFGRARRDPGRRLDRRVYDGYPAFNYHPSMIDGLVDVGFDVVSTANNHSLDRGALGVDRTILNMNKRGMAFTGTRPRKRYAGPPAPGNWAAFVRRKGFTTAWLACAEMTNGLPDRKKQVLFCYKDRKIVMREIKRLRARHDVDAVILTPHWGEEYKHRPARRQRTLARAAIEAGATAVIGTHPHVVQPWEKITTQDGREGLAVYSTGNFISGQVRFMRRAGALALLRLVRPEGGRARIASAGYIPTWVTFGGGHRVNPNEGKRGSRPALRQTMRVLPAGNRVFSKWPLEMPNACRTSPAAHARTASLGRDRHPIFAPMREEDMIRRLQTELVRVGCNVGTVDGVWGRKSRRALERFGFHSGASADTEPTRAVLETVSRYEGRACPAVQQRRTTVAASNSTIKDLDYAETFKER